MLAFPPTATKATASTDLIRLRKNWKFITVDNTSTQEHKEEETGWTCCGCKKLLSESYSTQKYKVGRNNSTT